MKAHDLTFDVSHTESAAGELGCASLTFMEAMHIPLQQVHTALELNV